jgi:hypothetical protein
LHLSQGETLTELAVALEVTMVDKIESSESGVEPHVGLGQPPTNEVFSSIAENSL